MMISNHEQLTTLIQAVERADTPEKLVTAVQNLVAARSVTAIGTLIAVLGYNNPGAAIAALEGLIQFGDVAVEPILEHLDEYNYGARAYAIRALAAIADPRALDVLLNAALNDFAPSVRRAACKGLGTLDWHQLSKDSALAAQTQTLEALITIAQDPDWAIRYAAIVGLQGLAIASAGDIHATIARQFEQMLETETDPAVRSRVVLARQQIQAAPLQPPVTP